jgi:hypothetical protein
MATGGHGPYAALGRATKMEDEPRRQALGDHATMFAFVVAPILTLLFAMQSGHEYSYFVFVRVVVCFCALVWLMIFSVQKNEFLIAVFLGIFLLYNPIIPVQLSREKWVGLDIASCVSFGGGFVWFLVAFRKKKKDLEK